MKLIFFLTLLLIGCSGPRAKEPPPEAVTHFRPEDDPAYPQAVEFNKFSTGEFTNSEVGELVEQCKKDSARSLFCYSIVNKPYLDEKVRSRRRPASKRFHRFSPRIKKGVVENWDELRMAAVSATIRSVATTKSANLVLLKTLALKEKECPNNVAVSIGAALEDELPEGTTLLEIAELYGKAGLCVTDNPADRENLLTRAGLFYFAGKNYPEAERYLKESAAAPDTFISRPLYWLYRSYLIQSKSSEAEKTLERLKNEYPFAFHTLIATSSHNEDPGSVLKKTGHLSLTRSQTLPTVNPLIEQVEVLQRLGFESSARKVLNWVVSESEGMEPELRIYLAELKKEQGDYQSKISILSEVLYRNPALVSKETMELYFPKVFFPVFEKQSALIDPYLLLAVARRESAFNPRAVSSANARGFMQLMPAVKKEFKRNSNLFNPEENVEVGAKYLLKLLRNVDGHIHMALAAYNAGPHKVKEWTGRYSVEDPILFIDLIPYRETREYVASVLRNYYWYRRIHQQDNELNQKRLLELAVKNS